MSAPWLWASVSSASQFVSIVGGAVSLLLVFRTNAAFARFCAAADSFADVLASTRNLSRKMAVWAPVTHRSSLAVSYFNLCTGAGTCTFVCMGNSSDD